MATDIISLGGFVFEGHSTPSNVPGGGDQAMAVHRLPGGARVIDTLGPDDAPIDFRGEMFGDDAYGQALVLDGMRRAGQKIPLIYGGQVRQVVIQRFTYHLKRFPNWVDYQISCTVVPDIGAGGLGSDGTSIDSLIQSDLSSAAGAASPADALASGIAPL